MNWLANWSATIVSLLCAAAVGALIMGILAGAKAVENSHHRDNQDTRGPM